MKDENVKSIWKIPKYLPYEQPALTPIAIKRAEQKMAVKLPSKYLEILSTQNGGYIRFTIPETGHSRISGIGPFFPSISEFDWFRNWEGLSFDLEGLFPFDGDGHWNICLDYRSGKSEPEVSYIDTERDIQKTIASDFTSYLKLLEVEREDYCVIEWNSTIEHALNEISNVLDIVFEAQGSLANGYPIYSSIYEGSRIWISSNTVPGAFIRPSDLRYDELKSQMEVMSVRFPEIGPNDLIFSGSNESQRQRMFIFLKTHGFKVNDLNEYVKNT